MKKPPVGDLATVEEVKEHVVQEQGDHEYQAADTLPDPRLRSPDPVPNCLSKLIGHSFS